MKIKQEIRHMLKHVSPSLYRLWIYRFERGIYQAQVRYREIVKRVKEKQHVNVMFVASSLAMWSYEELVDILIKDSRFSVNIVLVPFNTFSDEDRKESVEILAKYFEDKQISYRRVDGEDDFLSVKQLFAPDVIFYPQMYEEAYGNKCDWTHNTDCLLCYMPYGVSLSIESVFNNSGLPIFAWRYYVATKLHMQLAHDLADNLGRNARVVGEVRRDMLVSAPKSDPWRKIDDGCGSRRKRLVWAPHFSIEENDLFNRPDFVWCHKVMVDMAVKYKDEIQIAFKPHPRLKSELYANPKWGKEKADRYYKLWAEELPNTQLETGGYSDLFKTADAFIHNSGSFTAECLFVDKPSAYISRDWSSACKGLNELALACMDCYVRVSSAEDIERFILDEVIGENDSHRRKREFLLENMFELVGNQSAAKNIYADLVSSLGLR